MTSPSLINNSFTKKQIRSLRHTPENLLLGMHGHEPLKRHEDHARKEKISETEPVHGNRGDTRFHIIPEQTHANIEFE